MQCVIVLNNITNFTNNSIIILTDVIQCSTRITERGDIMSISVRLSDKDTELIKAYSDKAKNN